MNQKNRKQKYSLAADPDIFFAGSEYFQPNPNIFNRIRTFFSLSVTRYWPVVTKVYKYRYRALD